MIRTFSIKSLEIKKIITSIIILSILIFSSSTNIFANINNIELIGGSYEDIRNAKINYYNNNKYDGKLYDCHHLIAKGALKQWGDEIEDREGVSPFNNFILEDEDQCWAPSITMEQEDHKKTLSYFNVFNKSDAASEYIDEQARRIIEDGDIIGVLKDEINFIKKTFGHKYDRAINEVWDYIKTLEFRHENHQTLFMNHPYHKGWFRYNFRLCPFNNQYKRFPFDKK